MIREFGWNEALFVVMALRWTLALSAIAFCGGAVGGLVVALMRVSANRIVSAITIAFIRIFQGTPLLMQLFLVYFGITILGLGISPLLAAMIALTAHASAYLGEIWRGCIEAVPRGQSEASWALGLSYRDQMSYVVLPQAARIAVPPTVGFLVQIIKGTSLTALIGFVEVTRAGQIINNATFEPFAVFGLVGALYFALCWPLSLLAGWTERVLARSGAH